jgi:hypothetical protein
MSDTVEAERLTSQEQAVIEAAKAWEHWMFTAYDPDFRNIMAESDLRIADDVRLKLQRAVDALLAAEKVK